MKIKIDITKKQSIFSNNKGGKMLSNKQRQKLYRERIKITDLSKATAATINELRLQNEIQITEYSIKQDINYLKQLKGLTR